jgi:hypothetical protein
MSLFGSPICMQEGNSEDQQGEHFNLALPSLVSPRFFSKKKRSCVFQPFLVSRRLCYRWCIAVLRKQHGTVLCSCWLTNRAIHMVSLEGGEPVNPARRLLSWWRFSGWRLPRRRGVALSSRFLDNSPTSAASIYPASTSTTLESLGFQNTHHRPWFNYGWSRSYRM